jgi:thiamine-monophosphate kinase
MEFDLIALIKSKTFTDSSVKVGIGDDAAIITNSINSQLVVSTDTLVEGVHFDQRTTAKQIGHKSLAVNLSDLAAMAARPKWVTLNITLPQVDMQWIEQFITGFLQLADKHQVNLIGGDTTTGPLSITVTVFGEVEKNQYLLRSAAKRNDLIAVTGEIGSAAYALKYPNTALEHFLHVPEPQLKISQQIKTFAHSCIDISDGLLADLGHICSQSKLSAKISLQQIPVNQQIKNHEPMWAELVLTGGDDYQLCFTFSADDLNKLPAGCTVIGQMGCGLGVKVFSNNQQIDFKQKGFVHFNNIN